MSDAKKDKVTRAGAVEIDEAALDDVAGGASDYLLEIEGIKGESKATSSPLQVKISPGAIRGQKV